MRSYNIRLATPSNAFQNLAGTYDIMWEHEEDTHWRESISISAKDPKRTFGRRALVRLEPRMRRMMTAYPSLLDALVLSSGQSIISARGVGELGRQGFPVAGQGY